MILQLWGWIKLLACSCLFSLDATSCDHTRVAAAVDHGLCPACDEKKTGPKHLLWKERKGLSVEIPCSKHPWVQPFRNLTFHELEEEETAAIQFCVGNIRNFPSEMDREFTLALQAEGFCSMEHLLAAVFRCVSLGKDAQGNKLFAEVPMPMRHEDAGLDFYGMETVHLYVEEEWRGLCLLMTLRECHRLYGNRRNALMGIVVHGKGREEEAGALLCRALAKTRSSTRKVRGVLYTFHAGSGKYKKVERPCWARIALALQKGGGFAFSPVTSS
jgi:hypothetical protein